jgi:lipopolysaccharide transport protein LptA
MKMMNSLKIAALTILISFNLYGEDNYLNIDAKHFESNEKKQTMIFKENVKMTKNKDILLSQHLLINTQPSKNNPKKQIPKNYKATGDVSFVIHTANNILKGKGDTLYYYPQDQKYIIVGNGYLEDKEGKKLYADKIYIDEKTGHTKIDGDTNKPAKFRLKLNEE